MFDKDAKIYTGKKVTSSTNYNWRTECSNVKE